MTDTPNFLCLTGAHYGCDLFASGSNGKFVDLETALSTVSIPLCWAGSHQLHVHKHCIENHRKFYNLDNAYFGNAKKKEIIRVSVDALQDPGPLVDRSGDRLDNFKIQIENFKRGSSIVIVPPDRKIMHALRLSPDWIENLQHQIKKYTDRPIRIRTRPPSRRDRIKSDTFKEFVEHDTYLVIGYSSNALVEAIILGIPVISLGHSATKSFSNYDLADIENIPDIDNERRRAWLRHLSYKQFTREELSNGTAWRLLHT